MSDVVLQTVPIDFQWPTIDPFLFCVHHVDHYPPGNGEFGPVGSLAGRDIGQDFAGKDGWRMYHGTEVPGFPQHPHRGFETVTFVRRGLIDHADSLGAAARYGEGDVQWLTAGSGIVHAEMFPLLDTAPAADNTAELFQIWLNLPAEDKMAEPHFTMLWNPTIPRRDYVDDAGLHTEVTVVAGELDGVAAPAPPPRSWAARPDSDVAIWRVQMEAGGAWTLPAARTHDTVRVLYIFAGQALSIAGHEVAAGHAAVVRCDRDVELVALGAVEVLMLQGRPIGEPVARYGPFVMNTDAEIQQAFADYRRTQFGGWPWPADGPVHGPDPQRFARHTDGRVEIG